MLTDLIGSLFRTLCRCALQAFRIVRDSVVLLIGRSINSVVFTLGITLCWLRDGFKLGYAFVLTAAVCFRVIA